MTRLRARVWFGLFVTLVFVAGAGAGALIAPRLGPPAGVLLEPPPMMPGRPGPGGPSFMPGPLARGLAEELQLDAPQRERLQQLFATRRDRLRAFHDETRARYEREQRELYDELRTLLTPEQMQRFETWARRGPGRGARRRSPDPGRF